MFISLERKILMGYIEETNELKLDFNKITKMTGQEVIPVAIQNMDTKEVILVSYTNEQAMCRPSPFTVCPKQRASCLPAPLRNAIADSHLRCRLHGHYPPR